MTGLVRVDLAHDTSLEVFEAHRRIGDDGLGRIRYCPVQRTPELLCRDRCTEKEENREKSRVSHTASFCHWRPVLRPPMCSMFAAKFITSIDRRHRGVHPMSSDVFVRGVHACRSRMSDSKLHAATIMLAMSDGRHR